MKINNLLIKATKFLQPFLFRANFYSTSGDAWRVQIPSLIFLAAKMSVLGPIRSYSRYLRSAQGQFPL